MIVYPLKKQFVKNNPDVAYSAELLHYDYGLKMGKDFSKYEEAFQKLSPRVRNTRIGKTVAKYIASRKATEMGSIAPDFTVIDSNGKEVKLSDFRGKYVFFEFWGTWCGGCLYAIPFLKELRKEIPKEKLAMLSIACNERSEKAWKEFIQEKGVEWTQALEKDRELQHRYAIQGYPTFFLISPEGKILDKGMRVKERIKKLKEILQVK